MSRSFGPDDQKHEMNQFDEMTRAYEGTMPREFASAANLMAHPVAGFAAAGAIGLGMASHAIGLWMGTVAGMAEASRKLIEHAADAEPSAARPAKLTLVSSTPAPEAPRAAAVVASAVSASVKPVARKAVEARTGVAAQTPKPAARTGVADDLKAIAGIGPKLEKVLNGLGISTYAQVANLTKAEIDRLDDQLGFSGRIERDDWIGQARRLAGG